MTSVPLKMFLSAGNSKAFGVMAIGCVQITRFWLGEVGI